MTSPTTTGTAGTVRRIRLELDLAADEGYRVALALEASAERHAAELERLLLDGTPGRAREVYAGADELLELVARINAELEPVGLPDHRFRELRRRLGFAIGVARGAEAAGPVFDQLVAEGALNVATARPFGEVDVELERRDFLTNGLAAVAARRTSNAGHPEALVGRLASASADARAAVVKAAGLARIEAAR
jgi:hypothetical protein